MSKEYIKILVNESLINLSEDKKKDSKKKDSKKEDSKKEDSKKKDSEEEEKIEYQDIQNFWKGGKHSSVTKVGVFRDAGFSEKDIYTRLPYKKLDMEKNEDGGVYRFTKDEVDRIRTELDKYPRG